MTITDNTNTIFCHFRDLENGAIFKDTWGDVCIKIPAHEDADGWGINALCLKDTTYCKVSDDEKVLPVVAELIIKN